MSARERSVFNDYHVAVYYAQLGDRDRSIEILGQAIESRAPSVSYVLIDPRLDSLRGDPRFRSLLARTNFGLPRHDALITTLTGYWK